MEQSQPPRPRPSMESIRAREKITSQPVQKTKKSKRKPLIIIASIIVSILLLGTAGWMTYRQIQTNSLIDTSKYQAVLLSNGQWYFGKLHKAGDESYKLTNVFYLERQNGTDAENTDQKQLSDTTKPVLVKLGNEIHAPEDVMIIKDEQLIFYENIKDSGQVASLMKEYLDKNKN